MLHENEKLDDLLENELHIIRRSDVFAYGSDAIALAAFVSLSKKDIVLDIGTGTGILAILLCGRYDASFTAIEIDREMADMARRSVKLNSQEDKITVIEGDVRNMHKELGYESYSVIVCNPPYFSGGTKSENEISRNSRHDDTLNMDELAYSASRLLKNGGKLFLVYPSSRFAVCCASLVNNGIMPKRIKLIGERVLVEAKKGGKEGLNWEL
ncbi:MAG: methyltransferase [Clostridia bacterium]|nr:methyltransferase [Clostridia bacterium]